MKPGDLNEWPAQEPPSRLRRARFVEAARANRQRATGGKGMRVAAGLLLVASMGAVVATAAHLHGQVASGDVTAGERCEVHVGSRAVAVLGAGWRARRRGAATR